MKVNNLIRHKSKNYVLLLTHQTRFIVRENYQLSAIEQGTGNREQGVGSKEQGVGSKEQGTKIITIPTRIAISAISYRLKADH
ncbi:hypothetical protein BJP34_04400 [Moorena producens PAL-8-15-08-1]|uniref:Uncharacterized protein n=1 Tax=Moorena producens PAL-8-15-08-1 TaxID=1458985 RepID=A0A1D8TMF1_9CYAN|nr:hypothetical protein BJP34_04400 [Moorena producens PAL-8-15-08-1]